MLRVAVNAAAAVDKKLVKLTAWRCKKFAVMIKKKMNRGQHSRNKVFRDMVGILLAHGQDAHCNAFHGAHFPVPHFPVFHSCCGSARSCQDPAPELPDAEDDDCEEADEVLAIMDSQTDGGSDEEGLGDTQIEGDAPAHVPQYQQMDIDQAEIDAWTDRQPDEPSPYLGGEDVAQPGSKSNVGEEVAAPEEAHGGELPGTHPDFNPEDKKVDLYPSVADEQARIRALEKQLANARALQKALNLGVSDRKTFWSRSQKHFNRARKASNYSWTFQRTSLLKKSFYYSSL